MITRRAKDLAERRPKNNILTSIGTVISPTDKCICQGFDHANCNDRRGASEYQIVGSGCYSSVVIFVILLSFNCIEICKLMHTSPHACTLQTV